MIIYDNTHLGLLLVARVQGSALWKAFLPALFSSCVLVFYVYSSDFDVNERGYRNTGHFDHPYVVAAYVSFFSFLMTFRLNFAYQRYWEGCTAVGKMLSKWMDVATYCTAFHLQSKAYDKYRPPSFGEHQNLRNVTREREREEVSTNQYMESILTSLTEKEQQEKLNRKMWWKLLPGAARRMKKRQNETDRITSATTRKGRKNISRADDRQLLPAPRNFHDQWSIKRSNHIRTCSTGSRRMSLHPNPNHGGPAAYTKASQPVEIPYPSLFLQELTHLVSLMAGVALSTLRNDIPNAPSPLVEYFPGQPIPPENPEELSHLVRKEMQMESRVLTALYYVLGMTRDEHHRTLYNAARPFRILGGVSDLEIRELQKCNGPLAKVTLCTMYVQEFVSRESLNGSTGRIPAPILSRITHVLSDGMMGYNQARKLAYCPFPFVHAQMTMFFSIVVLFIFPLLYYSFVNNIYFACLLNFITVLCFLGIHEVARELENPFHNVPNDVPLTTYQAHFNESLITCYSGFHPDSFWEEEIVSNADTNKQQLPNSVETNGNIHPLKR